MYQSGILGKKMHIIIFNTELYSVPIIRKSVSKFFTKRNDVHSYFDVFCMFYRINFFFDRIVFRENLIPLR